MLPHYLNGSSNKGVLLTIRARERRVKWHRVERSVSFRTENLNISKSIVSQKVRGGLNELGRQMSFSTFVVNSKLGEKNSKLTKSRHLPRVRIKKLKPFTKNPIVIKD